MNNKISKLAIVIVVLIGIFFVYKDRASGFTIRNSELYHNGRLVHQVVVNNYVPEKFSRILWFTYSPDKQMVYLEACEDEQECLIKGFVNLEEMIFIPAQKCPKWGCHEELGWTPDGNYALFSTETEGTHAFTLYDLSSGLVHGNTIWLGGDFYGIPEECGVVSADARIVENEAVEITAHECVSYYSADDENFLGQPVTTVISFGDFLEYQPIESSL